MNYDAIWTVAGSLSLSGPTPQPGTTAVQVWTLIVAGLAVVATAVAAVLLRRTGKGTVEAAKKAAEASERSAQAAEKSASAAHDSVGVNRETAAGVAERAHADALSKRYQNAAAQLGHDKAPVRLAGAYAMARLADDWAEERQTCADVLCAYLRLPLAAYGAGAESGDEEVRLTIVKVLRDHLQPSARTSWSDLDLNFDGARLTNFQMDGATFRVTPSFRGATFIGDCSFKGAGFMAGVKFGASTVEGRLMLRPSALRGRLDLWGTVIEAHGELLVEYYDLDGPELQMNHMHIQGQLQVRVNGPGTTADLYPVWMDDVAVNGGKVDVRFGLPARPSNIYVHVRNWVATAESSVHVICTEGQGEPPAACKDVAWNMRWGTGRAGAPSGLTD